MHRTVPAPEQDRVALQAVNLATPLRRRGPVWASKAIITAGPAADGVTPNGGVLWFGNKDAAADKGQPLYPGDTLELGAHELGGAFDLAQLFFVGAVATDVLRLTWWRASEPAAAIDGGAQ